MYYFTHNHTQHNQKGQTRRPALLRKLIQTLNPLGGFFEFRAYKHGFNTQLIIKLRPLYTRISADKRIILQLCRGGLLQFRIPFNGRREDTSISKFNM